VLDYKTGSYRALKIIRNKKRFHHQAQVGPAGFASTGSAAEARV
jgi:hypothetical protein